MHLLATIILVVLVVLGAFVTLNWSVLSTPAALSFLFVTVDAPPGLILFGAALLLVAVLFAYAALQRTTMLIESRRHAQELRAQRDIAERAEASRLHELQAQLERECAGLRTNIRESGEQHAALTREFEATIRKALEEATNSLAACVGQVDDKLDRLR